LSGGRVRGDGGECLFDGAAADGLNSAAAAPPPADNPPTTARPLVYVAKEMWGLVFIFYHEEGLAPSWTLEGIWEGGGVRAHGATEHHVRAHIQVRLT
jgi:cholesterol 7-desaturase